LSIQTFLCLVFFGPDHLLKYYKHSKIDINEVIDLVVRKSKIYEIAPLPAQICRDINDDMFLACALAAKIKIIVSGDADLLELSGYNQIEVIKPRQFIDNYI
jgi:putative PIN family toxin of toxin-antitoxin system